MVSFVGGSVPLNASLTFLCLQTPLDIVCHINLTILVRLLKSLISFLLQSKLPPCGLHVPGHSHSQIAVISTSLFT